jgi:hypothetical protein
LWPGWLWNWDVLFGHDGLTVCARASRAIRVQVGAFMRNEDGRERIVRHGVGRAAHGSESLARGAMVLLARSKEDGSGSGHRQRKN